MSNVSDAWTPRTAILIWRIGSLLAIAALWLFGNSGFAGIVLLLVLAIMAAARQRFAIPGWSVLIDQAACLAVTAVWPDAWYALAVPAFEALLAGRLRFVLPSALAVLVHNHWTLPLFVILVHAALTGRILRAWSRQLERARQETDRERSERYEWERLKNGLLIANARTARLSELNERRRIAAELHDHAGHELTAAILALQAFEQLRKDHDPQADSLFDQAVERLSNSARYLRDTVHSAIPAAAVGIRQLEEICRSFVAFPIRFLVHGDTSRIPIYLWTILEPCLKEALTNAARHSRASQVEVTLDVSERIVRLSVRDNGIGDASSGYGIGLRNLRQRARAVGGSLSTDSVGGYKLVCVLPLEHRE